MAKNPNKIRAKRVASDYVIDIIMIVTIVLVLVLTLYPFLNSLAISLNDSNDTTLGGLTIYPRKFTWRNYELVFTNQKSPRRRASPRPSKSFSICRRR